MDRGKNQFQVENQVADKVAKPNNQGPEMNQVDEAKFQMGMKVWDSIDKQQERGNRCKEKIVQSCKYLFIFVYFQLQFLNRCCSFKHSSTTYCFCSSSFITTYCYSQSPSRQLVMLQQALAPPADHPVPHYQPLPHHDQHQVVEVQALRTLIQVQDEDEVCPNSTHLT